MYNSERRNTMLQNTRPRRGSIVALVAVLLPVLMVVMAYSIHVAYVESISSRTQVVADIVARSAGRRYATTADRELTLEAARFAAQQNPIAGAEIPVEMSDLEFGVSDRSNASVGYSFEPLTVEQEQEEPGNAVRFSTGSLSNSSTVVIGSLFPSLGGSSHVHPLKVAANTQGSIDIGLVLDRSGSMRWASDEDSDAAPRPADEPPGWTPGDPISPASRWLDTVRAVDAFIDYLRTSERREKISLSTYSHNTTTNLPLTQNLSLVRPALDEISNAFMGGSTAIGMGLAEGQLALLDPGPSRSWASKIMIIMTDGIHNTGMDPEPVAQALAEEGVILFTITFGAAADQERMTALAEISGGQHFHASDGSELTNAFQEIGRRLPSLLTQ